MAKTMQNCNTYKNCNIKIQISVRNSTLMARVSVDFDIELPLTDIMQMMVNKNFKFVSRLFPFQLIQLSMHLYSK